MFEGARSCMLVPGCWMNKRRFSLGARTAGHGHCTKFPILGGARFAKDVERTGLDQPLHFFIERIDAGEEIVERGEFAAVSFGEDCVPGALSKSFDVKDVHADGFINYTEL